MAAVFNALRPYQRPCQLRERLASIRSRSLAAILTLGSIACAADAAAQDPAPTALAGRIEALVAQAKLSPQLGLSVIDLASGRNVVAINGQLPLNPASNLKLLTAATALTVLGPDFRMQTGLYGYVRQERTEGLCIKGHADPTFTRAQLAEFVQRLRERGVREVDQVLVDGSYFDAELLPPAFDQQPNETAPFRAAVGAVSVNANAYTLRVGPGPVLGSPARVAVDGAGYFALNNQVTTSAAPIPNVVISERDLGDHVEVSLNGTIPLTGATLALPRRVASPLYYAGYVFIDALSAAGIRTSAKVQLGQCRADAPLISRIESQPLAQMLTLLGKNSDNFVAETLLKVLAAERTHKPGATSAGVSVVQETLRRLDLPLANLTMINGSGLFQGNQVTTGLFSQLLARMYNDPSYGPEYIAHLSVGGADGTLARRYSNLPVPRIVRAKTGTLNDVIALSGYVLGPAPGKAYAFSFLANGIKGKQGQARSLIDKVVEQLAAELYAKP